MIITIAVVCAAGLLAGYVADDLLRGRDPRATHVITAGLIGALTGLGVRLALAASRQLGMPCSLLLV